MTEDRELEEIRRRKLERLMSPEPQGSAPTGKVVEVTDASFKDFLRSNRVAVIDFWAPWCGPCRMIAPVVKELAREMAGKVAFGKMNVDENRRTAGMLGIMSIPTVMVFRDGKPVDAVIGAVPKQHLAGAIMKHL